MTNTTDRLAAARRNNWDYVKLDANGDILDFAKLVRASQTVDNVTGQRFYFYNVHYSNKPLAVYAGETKKEGRQHLENKGFTRL